MAFRIFHIILYLYFTELLYFRVNKFKSTGKILNFYNYRENSNLLISFKIYRLIYCEFFQFLKRRFL